MDGKGTTSLAGGIMMGEGVALAAGKEEAEETEKDRPAVSTPLGLAGLTALL